MSNLTLGKFKANDEVVFAESLEFVTESGSLVHISKNTEGTVYRVTMRKDPEFEATGACYTVYKVQARFADGNYVRVGEVHEAYLKKGTVFGRIKRKMSLSQD